MWDDDAVHACQQMPVPPMMSSYARIQCEKLARQKGLERVSIDIVLEAEKLYADFLGKEKTQELRAFITENGPAPEMEDELFFDDETALYHIDCCYTKYGENTKQVRNLLKDLMGRLKAVFEMEKMTEIIADLAPVALHGASRFTVVMTGCPNCCVSPYLKDFGITLKHRVDITDAECTFCGECLKMCMDKAITLGDEGPIIDRRTCSMCALCERDCPTDKLVIGETGYRVLAGGTAGRKPKIALTVEEYTTSRDRVLDILVTAIKKLRAAKTGENLRTIIDREGVEIFNGEGFSCKS